MFEGKVRKVAGKPSCCFKWFKMNFLELVTVAHQIGHIVSNKRGVSE